MFVSVGPVPLSHQNHTVKQINWYFVHEESEDQRCQREEVTPDGEPRHLSVHPKSFVADPGHCGSHGNPVTLPPSLLLQCIKGNL